MLMKQEVEYTLSEYGSRNPHLETEEDKYLAEEWEEIVKKEGE